jgi:hypothetical protein
VIADEQPQKVQVKLTDGSELVLQQPTVSGDTLMGLEGDDQRHIPLADVSAIEVRRTDALLTTAFVFGTVVVVGAIAVGVAWAIYCSDTYDC